MLKNKSLVLDDASTDFHLRRDMLLFSIFHHKVHTNDLENSTYNYIPIKTIQYQEQ